MKVAHRLYLTTVPAVLGVFAVAGLAYWGQYARVIPELLLMIAAVAAVSTLIVAWVNVRYVARRVERLAHSEESESTGVSLRGVASAVAPGHVTGQPDELDAIETVVDRLSSAVALAESSRVEGERKFEERARDYARMLAIVAENAAKGLDEVRLPLHILLENHFGDLNENQEEMLGAARTAAEAVDGDLVALRQIAELDLGVRTLRRDRIFPADVTRALLPTLRAVAEKAGAALHADIEPLVPAIWADQPQLQDALTTLLQGALVAMQPDTAAEMTVTRDGSGARITLCGAEEPARNIRMALAARIIEAHGGYVRRTAGTLTIQLVGANAARPM